MNIENKCVHCGEDTSFGSGKFVNRISADSDTEAEDNKGNIIFSDGEYRDGYSCSDCLSLECDRCDELIPINEDLTSQDVLGFMSDEFTDGAYRVHQKCLTKEETQLYNKHKERLKNG